MKKLFVLISAILLLLAGCSSNESTGKDSEQPTPTSQSVTTDGSTSMEKLIGTLGEAFSNETGIQFSYNSTGSGSGIKAVVEKRVDIGLSSRKLKDEEIQQGLVETTA